MMTDVNGVFHNYTLDNNNVESREKVKGNNDDGDVISGAVGNNHIIDFHSHLFSSLNLNDVITIEDIEEVIEKDKKKEVGCGLVGGVSVERKGEGPMDPSSSVAALPGCSGKQQRQQQQQQSRMVVAAETKILIQPAQKALRFRYECEGRSAGSIPGANSTPENKTYPTIQVVNYNGPAVVVVSCVTKDKPYRPHPHKLVGKEGCKRGVCTVTINNDNMICSFSNLGIQCVKRKDIEEALRERAEANIDPFGTSANHRNQTGNIDLNSVRLCFQVFLKRDPTLQPLQPIVSDPIYDKKSMCDLVICKLSACSASVWGGVEIIVLCEKIVRDDIQVRFYEVKEGQVVWEGFGDFQPSDVHKQVAISLKTPKYHDTEIQHPIEAYIQLKRPSDGTYSDARSFQFLPADSDPEGLKRKRQKIASASLGLYLAENTATASRGDLRPSNPFGGPIPRVPPMEPRLIRQPHRTRIKREPPDVGYTGMPAGYSQPTSVPLQRLPSEVRHPRQLPPHYYESGQVTSPMDTTSPSTIQMSTYNSITVPNTSSSSPLLGMYVVNQMSNTRPEVITIPSHSSSGGSNPMFSGSNPAFSGPNPDVEHHQNLSSGSTHLSLGLGSLGSLPLSESTLSIIGSHLCDTFMCLNSDSIEAQLNSGGNMEQAEHYAAIVAGREAAEAAFLGGAMGPGVDDQQQQQQQGREQSMDSFSGLLSQLTQLNQMGAVGGMDTSPQTSINKYQS